MKKIIAILLAVLLIVAMAIPVHAVTPGLDVPDMPEIPDLSDDIHVTIPDEVLDKWFEENPIDIIRPTEPAAPHEPMDAPDEAEIPARWGWMDWIRGWFWWVTPCM